MDIYTMSLNQTLNLGKIQIIRVPGGWIYNFQDGGEVFVPYNDEFKKE